MMELKRGHPLHRAGWWAMGVVPGLGALVLGKTALEPVGWRRSVRAKASVDKDGNPIPWLNYAAIRFLEGKTGSGLQVFEYGAGNSSMWWATRVSSVVSCEHDSGWGERVRSKLPANAELVRYPMESEDYVSAAMEWGAAFDVIVIDGVRRAECASYAQVALTPGGVIVLDNSDTNPDAAKVMEEGGYKRIDFWGLAPATVRFTQTSVFYRDGNCLGI